MEAKLVNPAEHWQSRASLDAMRRPCGGENNSYEGMSRAGDCVPGRLARGHGVGLFAFGGAYWPLATAHSDPLRARTCFGRVNGAPG